MRCLIARRDYEVGPWGGYASTQPALVGSLVIAMTDERILQNSSSYSSLLFLVVLCS